jgi:hypothetical protein
MKIYSTSKTGMITMWSINSSSKHILQFIHSMPWRDFHTNSQSSITANGQNMEAMWIPTNGCIYQEAKHGIHAAENYSALKRKVIPINISNMDEPVTGKIRQSKN